MTGTGSRWRRRSSSPTRGRARRRGVSDVVATILLLGLTVTLFASIFAFVTAFPLPPAQNNDQFQASLVYSPNGLNVTSIHILHLAGPLVSGTGVIYLKSSTQPSQPEFQTTYTVSQGLGGANSWNLGQVWNWTFSAPYIPSSQGNITIYVVASSQLLFSVILPGTGIAAPPTVVSTWISPATPAKAQAFTVYATLAGAYNSPSVFVNLSAVPGLPGTAKPMSQNAQGQWYYQALAGATSNGTFYGFVNASSSAGQQAVGAVMITIAPTTWTATLTLTPTKLSHSTTGTVTVVGTGFVGSTNVTVTLNGSTIAPTICATTGVYVGSSYSGATIVTTSGGAFSCSFAVGKSWVGTFVFEAYDLTSGQTATALFARY